MRTVYLGVDDLWFDPPQNVSRSAAHLRVVISGRLVPWKGHHTFLRAFAEAADHFPDAEAWIVGGGDEAYAAVLEREAARLRVRERVRFWGHRQDAMELVRQCDVAMLCSEREPFGLVIIEGMACGIPVIASDVQGPREIIRPGETGSLPPPETPKRSPQPYASCSETGTFVGESAQARPRRRVSTIPGEIQHHRPRRPSIRRRRSAASVPL